RIEPRPVQRPDPEHVPAVPRERVPQADTDPEVLLHSLAEDQPIRLVDLEGEGVGRVKAPEPDRLMDFGEEAIDHRQDLPSLPLGPITRRPAARASNLSRTICSKEAQTTHGRGRSFRSRTLPDRC